MEDGPGGPDAAARHILIFWWGEQPVSLSGDTRVPGSAMADTRKMKLWSARTCPRFESGDKSPQSKAGSSVASSAKLIHHRFNLPA
jgi:hypothetical protein